MALEDSEYPSWLWGVLSEGEAKAGSASVVDEGDLFCTFHYTDSVCISVIKINMDK